MEMKLRKVVKKSALPVYAFAACWFLYALFFPIYKIWHILLVAAISLSAYYLASLRFKPEVTMVEEKIKSGDEEVDLLISSGEQKIGELRTLSGTIKNETVKQNIDSICTVSRQIFRFVAENHKKAQLIRKFFNYYLPTTLKLVKSYEELESQGIGGENIDGAKKSIEGIMGTINAAFKKQLDALFKDSALDISTDIDVLEGMLAAEGLKKDKLQ